MKISLPPLLLVVVILELSSVNVECQADPVAPYITFGGSVLQNHSYIDLYQIGSTVSDGVQCHTDLTTCCNSSFGSHSGQWFSYASGITLGDRPYFPGRNIPLYRRGFQQGLALLSASSFAPAHSVNGLYRCDIDTNASTDGGSNTDVSLRESVYVGIYIRGG